MTLTAFQKTVLRTIAANRSPESVFAGGATLNRSRPRTSRDLDIEHWTKEAVQASFEADATALSREGLNVAETRRSRPANGFAQAIVSYGTNDTTLIDWTTDSAFRFLPVVKDPDFGYRLDDIDLAVNKVLALAGRREPRDYYDVVHLLQGGLPLAALAWAAPAKDPGFTPFSILDECSRHSAYSLPELEAGILTSQPLDPVALKTTLREALEEARILFPVLPPNLVGNLFLDSTNRVRLPDPALIANGVLHPHGGSIGGAWPSVHPHQPNSHER
jgi:hypothetical protein